MDAARLEELVQSAGTSRISSKETTFGRNGTTKGCQAVSSYTSESHCKKKLSKNQVLVYPLRPKGNVRDVILLLCVFEIRSCVQDGGIILYRWMPKSDRNYVHSSVENIGVRRM